jgi:hypothetical protein
MFTLKKNHAVGGCGLKRTLEHHRDKTVQSITLCSLFAALYHLSKQVTLKMMNKNCDDI